LRHSTRYSMVLCWCWAGIWETCLTPVVDCSTETLLAAIKVCIFPSNTIVIDRGYIQRYSWQWRTHTHAIERCVIFVNSLTGAHTNTIDATWKNIEVHLRLYWENKVKCVINRLKCSVSAGFEIPELIAEHCVRIITTLLVHIFHLSYLSGYFPNILKLAEIQPNFKRAMNSVWKILDPYQYIFFPPKILEKCLKELILGIWVYFFWPTSWIQRS
jgi:hypothetical protein